MERGWIKLWRRIEDSAIFQNEEILKLWLLCLISANHKETYISIPGVLEPVKIKPGQFLTGRYELHAAYYKKKKKTNKSPLTVWRWLKFLEKVENLNIKSCSKYSIITINNWEAYQENEHLMNTSRTPHEHLMNTNKNVKNYKNEKNTTNHFDEFWKAYPKKVGKGAAKKAWNKIKPTKDTLEKILSAIESQKHSDQWLKDNGQFIPYPATWLNQERWEDEEDSCYLAPKEGFIL